MTRDFGGCLLSKFGSSAMIVTFFLGDKPSCADISDNFFDLFKSSADLFNEFWVNIPFEPTEVVFRLSLALVDTFDSYYLQKRP